MKPTLKCGVPGCQAFAEYDPSDNRPWIYHYSEDGVLHCAGANPNFWERKKKQYVPVTSSVKRRRDHMLQEYYGNKKRKIEEDEEDG